MKYLLFCLLLVIAEIAPAQKYALLDERFEKPVKFTNSITAQDKFEHYFPVERKMIPRFIKALKEIENKISSTTSPMGNLKQYEMGCVSFTGRIVLIAGVEKMDYMITSFCDNQQISMHLCRAKASNAVNAFFIKTWIKYIESNIH